MGIVTPGEDLTFVQVYDGDKGWVKTMGYVSLLDGKTLTMFVWDKYIDNFFLHFEEDGYADSPRVAAGEMQPGVEARMQPGVAGGR